MVDYNGPQAPLLKSLSCLSLVKRTPLFKRALGAKVSLPLIWHFCRSILQGQ